jgi:NADH-quinone oxidoreductase subunit M
VAFGKIENPQLEKITDLDAREWVMFAPLIVATLVLGFAPMLALDFTRVSVQAILAGYDVFASAR